MAYPRSPIGELLHQMIKASPYTARSVAELAGLQPERIYAVTTRSRYNRIPSAGEVVSLLDVLEADDPTRLEALQALGQS